MSTNQTITQEIASLMTGNLIYQDNYANWEYLYTSYIGGQDYRRAGLLTRYQLETESEYWARCQSTPLENHCRSVVAVYISFLFRECAKREFGSMENLPEVQDFMEDADMEGRDLDSFMKEVSTWASVFGHCWIIMAKPDIGAATLADEQAQGVRPYVNLVTPLMVLDWTWTRQPNGRFELSYLKYLEEVNGDVKVVKEWYKDSVRTIVLHEKDNIIEQDYVEVNGLGQIPAIIAYNSRSMLRGVGVSDISDIADAQRFIYNATSEVEQSIRLDSHPSLVKTPETQAGIGAGSLIEMPDNLDPGLRPYVLEFSGANVNSIYEAIRHTNDNIDKMANTGSVRATEQKTMSGIALQTEFQLLNARLSEKADNLELAEEQLWQLFAQYQGQVWDGKVEYPSAFDIRDTDNEIERLKVAADTNPADPRVKAAIDAKILDWLDLDEDEVTAMMNPDLVDLEAVPEDTTNYESKAMINPESGEVVMTASAEQELQLAKLGWVEKDTD